MELAEAHRATRETLTLIAQIVVAVPIFGGVILACFGRDLFVWDRLKHYLAQGATALIVGTIASYSVERWLSAPIHSLVCHYIIGPC